METIDYKKRIFQKRFDRGLYEKDAFFDLLKTNTDTFTHDIVQYMHANHVKYSGGYKMQSELVMPPWVKIRPLAVKDQIVDYIIVNEKTKFCVSQMLLSQNLGRGFKIHIRPRQYKFDKNDDTLTTVPVMNIIAQTRAFYCNKSIDISSRIC